MQNWKAILTYDGTPFHGWQIQPNLPTIQGTLAHTLHHVTGETVLPQGSGRTDTGVHALAQVATFALEAPIPAPNLLRALNRALPRSIRILSVDHVAPDFHARHSALRKTYEYRIHPTASTRICSPMLAPWVWDLPAALDLSQLNRASSHILGTHDFASFAASDPDLTTRTGEPSAPSTLRTILDATWTRTDDLYTFRITGNGFLHHMVRNLVGTFVEVSLNRIHPDAIPAILAARNRSAAGPTAPARGLFLVNVIYPDLEPRSALQSQIESRLQLQHSETANL